MSKYIDAYKLIAEIERRLKIVEPHKDTFESAAACEQELIWMKDFIISLQLQQEQPEVDLEEEIEFEWAHREKQEVDLIKCAEMDKEEFARFARKFWDKGYNARKEE